MAEVFPIIDLCTYVPRYGDRRKLILGITDPILIAVIFGMTADEHEAWFFDCSPLVWS